MLKPLALAASAALLAGPALAHVTLGPATAAAGANYIGAFVVGHGCGGADTVALRIELPPSIVAARPAPKAGWTLTIERTPLPAPVKGEGGQMLTDRPSAFTWRGDLPSDEFDEFRMLAKLPDAPGQLVFPAIQTCANGEERWVDVAAPGGPRPLHPAPILTVRPSTGDAMGAMPGMDGGH